MTTVLVAEDDTRLRLVMAETLRRDGYDVLEAGSGEQALEVLADGGAELLLLDLGLPGRTGLEVLTEVRRSGDLPVIVVTGHEDETERILGLELGADDFVVKPVSPREVAARVRAVLRRVQPRITDTDEALRYDGLVIDPMAREVRRDGEPIELTAREFDLLAFLAKAPRRVFTREQLLKHVWGSDVAYQDPNTVTEHVRRVRVKIEREPKRPTWLQTVRGVGYRFAP